jgi:two-component sensor histidine kinase
MNAVKYAFQPDGEGEIRISFTQDASSYRLQVSDDGRGFQRILMPGKASPGYGTDSQLTHQLREN